MKNTLNTLILPACTALALLGATATTSAAAYMKLGDIKGESTDNDHKDWIIIESMSSPIFRSVALDTTTGQRSIGKLVIGDLSCTKLLDRASPKIAEAICNGTVIPEVLIQLTRSVPTNDGTGGSRETPYMTYKLKDVIVTSFQFHGNSTGGPLPTEEITLGYTEVEWTYITIDPKTGASSGKVEASWKVEEGQK